MKYETSHETGKRQNKSQKINGILYVRCTNFLIEYTNLFRLSNIIDKNVLQYNGRITFIIFLRMLLCIGVCICVCVIITKTHTQLICQQLYAFAIICQKRCGYCYNFYFNYKGCTHVQASNKPTRIICNQTHTLIIIIIRGCMLMWHVCL